MNIKKLVSIRMYIRSTFTIPQPTKLELVLPKRESEVISKYVRKFGKTYRWHSPNLECSFSILAGGYLSFQIHRQNEEFRRGNPHPIYNGSMSICSIDSPQIAGDTIFLRGTYTREDNRVNTEFYGHDILKQIRKCIVALTEWEEHNERTQT